jgi:hypothetical protein
LRASTVTADRPFGPLRLIAVIALAACARTEHVAVDLELDILADLPVEADAVRICAADGPGRTFGAGDARYALTGLPDDPEVTVDVLDASETVVARTGPLVLDAAFASAPLDACDDCAPCIGGGPPAADPLTLGVRFFQ